MAENDPRQVLDALIRDRREDYASLSRLIGRNAAYVHQFIKRGVPKKLDEQDRRTLARYFGIDEAALGGPAAEPAEPKPGALVMVTQLRVKASAGHGRTIVTEEQTGRFGFDARWLRELAGTTTSLSLIRVIGDSMVPTLGEGDDILVNLADAAERLRDGIYVLRVEDTLIVKRIALNPLGGRITIRSDNDAYPAWEGCDRALMVVIGRAIWTGRCIL
jgi:phage repressor protein C with HTH and peptisase S24 domain